MLDYRPERPSRAGGSRRMGSRSGNLMWEAVLHGLLERIERDALHAVDLSHRGAGEGALPSP